MDNAGKILPIEELQVPAILYKYRCFGNEYHERTLFERKVYIPSAKEFNDPYDSKIPFRYRNEDLTEANIYEKCLALVKTFNPGLVDKEYQEKAYEMHRNNLLKDPHHLQDFDNQTFERLCKDYGIYCVTSDPENLLMWSYYADSHKGFCIGYNSHCLTKCGLFGMGGQVLYRNEFPKLPLFLKNDDHPMLDILFTKWSKWEHENEYRLIHRYRKGKIFKLPDEAICEVVLGCQMSDKFKFVQMEKIRKALPHVKIYQIEQAKDTFGLKKVAVFDEKLFI